MEPALQQLCGNASLLLEGTVPDEQSTKSFEATLTDEKKRYYDTLEAVMTTSDMLKSGYYGYYVLHIAVKSLIFVG